MHIQYGSVHHRILERLCIMPRAVRGISAAMLQRQFGDTSAIDDLISNGLIKKRGWADGPGSVLVPTPEGEALVQSLQASHHGSLTARTNRDRVILPQRSNW